MQPGIYNKKNFMSFEELLDRKILSLDKGVLSSNIYDEDAVFNVTKEEYEKIVKTLEKLGVSVPYEYADIFNPDLYEEIDEFFSANFSTNFLQGTLVLPESVKVLDEHVFYSLVNLEEVVLPQSLEIIKPSAFACSTNLKKVNIPENIKVIPKSCFYKCERLEEITLPENLEIIEAAAFFECLSLKNIKLPKSLKELGISSFRGCKTLESINLTENMQEIPQYCFSHCYQLKSVNFGNSIKEIQELAFYFCERLEDVILPKSLTSIRRCAFFNTGIEELELPASVKKIGTDAFEECKNLKVIYAYKNDELVIKCQRTKEKIKYLNTIENMFDSGRTFKQINQIYKELGR